MAPYLRKWTVFALASPRLLEIAVIVMTVSAPAFAENPYSFSTQSDGALANVQKKPIQCEVTTDVTTTDGASLTCTFPLDIEAYQLGFYVQADNLHHEEKKFTKLIITCYWENTPTASLRCLPKDNSKTNEKYEKSTNKTTLSIPMTVARSNILSCHLSSYTLQSRPCQLLGSVHQDPISCIWNTPVSAVVGVLCALLLVSLSINAVFVKNWFNRRCAFERIGNLIICQTCKENRNIRPKATQPSTQCEQMTALLPKEISESSFNDSEPVSRWDNCERQHDGLWFNESRYAGDSPVSGQETVKNSLDTFAPFNTFSDAVNITPKTITVNLSRSVPKEFERLITTDQCTPRRLTNTQMTVRRSSSTNTFWKKN